MALGKIGEKPPGKWDELTLEELIVVASRLERRAREIRAYVALQQPQIPPLPSDDLFSRN